MPIQPGSPATQMPPDLGWIRQELDEIKRWQREALPSVRNSVAPVIDEILAVQAQQATTQAALAQQQATLSAQVAQINALVNGQVAPGAGNAAAQTGISGAWANYATVNIPIPAGYTRAQVFGVASTSVPASTADELRVDVNGSVGPGMIILGGAGAVSYALTLTGLNGGVVSVSTQTRNAAGSPASPRVLVTSATAMFLR